MFIRRLSKGIKALSIEMTKPESFVKGEDFEEFVRNVLFPRVDYTLIHKSHNYYTNNRDYVESSMFPDFRFRDRDNEREFWVEAKWRNGRYNQDRMINWCKQHQLDRYKSIDRNDTKVFIALGLGGTPLRPKRVVLFPVSSCNFCDLYNSFIKNYSFFINKPVFSGKLWKLK